MPCKKMMKRYDGSTNGAAVQLYPPENDKPLVICEGIETALAAHELLGLPTWAAISANGIKQFTPPENIRAIWIYADNDTPRPIGFDAAHSLAIRLIKQGYKTNIQMPEMAGFDALDELNAIKAACTSTTPTAWGVIPKSEIWTTPTGEPQ